MARSDGRLLNQIRPFSLEQGLLNRADGSIMYSHEKTSVIVGVYGPVEASVKVEKIEGAVVQVEISSSTVADGVKELAYLISRTLEPIVVASLHPRCSIKMSFHVVSNDGSLLAVMINAGCMALIHAGIAITGTVTSLSMCMIKGDIYLDPTLQEEDKCDAITTVAVSDSGEIIMQDSKGLWSIEHINMCSDISINASSKIKEFFRKSTVKRVEQGV